MIIYLESVIESLFDDGSDTSHVFVRGVGARANQTVLHFQRPAILLGSGALQIEKFKLGQ